MPRRHQATHIGRTELGPCGGCEARDVSGAQRRGQLKHREPSIDDNCAELGTDGAFDELRRLDRLAHGGLLGGGDEQDLAAGRVSKHLHDLFGLLADRPASCGVGHAVGALEETDSVARRRRVKDDQVRRFGLARGGRPFHLLDLPEQQHVRHTGNGRRNDVQRTARNEAARQAPHTVPVQVLDQRGVRPQGAGCDLAALFVGVKEDRLVPEGPSWP